MIDPILQSTAALTLALVFGIAGVGKMMAWAELEGVIRNYRIAPGALAPLLSRVVPPVEILVTIAVLIPATRALGGLGALVLLTVFAVAMGINLLRGRTDIDCGCFRSTLRQNLSWWLLVRNAILAVLALGCLMAPAERDLGWADSFVIVMASLVLLLSYLSTSYVTLRRPPTFEENYERTAPRAS
jgi:hypothetical protein